MDPVYKALISFERREFEECIATCSQILSKNPYDEAMWSLKTRALTECQRVDDIEADEEGIVDLVLDDNAINQVPRPGTSLKATGPVRSASTSSQAYRPTSQSGRPLSGIVRPGSQAGRPGTMDAALKTPRTTKTARPISAASGRFVRLGTASMLTQQGGPFINLARLNIGKYCKRPNVAKALFEYIFHHENSVREAMELASQALQASNYEDWYWKVQLGKCYFHFAMYRDAEKMYKSALKQQEMIDTFLLLSKVYIRLDQPMSALEVYRSGLDKFPNDVCLLTGMARIYEAIGNIGLSTKYYKIILGEDSINVEAIACIGMEHFYADQPELSLRFYRRLLQMGVHNSELYNNLGLCCFFAQQYDFSLTCMERAISLAEDPETKADVWYNLGHIGLNLGDINMAHQCFSLALTNNHTHAEAFNNLGVLEMRRGNLESARAFFASATSDTGSHLFEPAFNTAHLSEKTGDLQTAYVVVQKSLKNFPDHHDSNELLRQLKKHFSVL